MFIKYKDNNGFCLDKCKFYPCKIGSVACKSCAYNINHSTDMNIVNCSKYKDKPSKIPI